MKNEKFCTALVRVIVDTIEIEGVVPTLQLVARAYKNEGRLRVALEIEDMCVILREEEEYNVTKADIDARDESLVSLAERSIRGEDIGMPDPDDIPEPTTR